MMFVEHQLAVNSAKDVTILRLKNRIRRHIPTGYVTDEKFCLYFNLGASYNRTIKLFAVRGTVVDSPEVTKINYRVLPTVFVMGIQIGLIIALVASIILFCLGKVSAKMVLFGFAICLLYFLVVAGQGHACREYFERSIEQG